MKLRFSSIRVLLVSALATAMMLTLTGCVLVPLLDDRSPFDSTSNPSNAQVDRAIPVLQTTLDGVDVGPNWQLVASKTASNCSGACDLRLLVEIMPTIDLLSEEVTQLLTEELDFLAEESDAGVPNKLPLGEAHTRIVVSIPVEVWRDAAAAAISAAEQLNLDAESTR